MNSFFGEIIEPSTRALWDDYEDIEENCEAKSFTWKCMYSDQDDVDVEERLKLLKLKTLILFDGNRILNFINGIILKDKLPMYQLDNGKVSLFDYPNEQLMVCVCEETDINVFGQITELLDPILTNTIDVITVTFQPSVTFKGDSRDDMDNGCFIRSLNTKLKYVKTLEIPNIITGVSAGVASWRYINHLLFSSYIIFMDSPYFDSVSIKPIVKLFRDLGLKCDDKYVPKILIDSNLYI